MRAVVLSLILLSQPFVHAHAASAREPAATSHRVVMYTTKSCGYCVRARQYFTERGIRWTEIDIEDSAKAVAAFEALGGRGTPLIFIGKQRIVGFDQEKIEAAL